MLKNNVLKIQLLKALLIGLIITSAYQLCGVGYFVLLYLKSPSGDFEHFIYASMSLLRFLPFWIGTLILGLILKKGLKTPVFIGAIIPTVLLPIYILLIALKTFG